MKADIDEFVKDWTGPLKVVSNLPYYITTPIVMMLLEGDIQWDTMVFMVQKRWPKGWLLSRKQRITVPSLLQCAIIVILS